MLKTQSSDLAQSLALASAEGSDWGWLVNEVVLTCIEFGSFTLMMLSAMPRNELAVGRPAGRNTESDRTPNSYE
jgi:hypothetical protein